MLRRLWGFEQSSDSGDEDLQGSFPVRGVAWDRSTRLPPSTVAPARTSDQARPSTTRQRSWAASGKETIRRSAVDHCCMASG